MIRLQRQECQPIPCVPAIVQLTQNLKVRDLSPDQLQIRRSSEHQLLPLLV